MRFDRMKPTGIAQLLLPAMLLALGGCERSEPQPEAKETPALAPAPVSPAPAGLHAASPAPRLDLGALGDRGDPDRLLRFYAAALRDRNWSAASRAWGANSGVTAETLKAAYDRPDAPHLAIGRGEVDGAAGSLYYEAPVELSFGDGPPEKGTLTLRRVNDVPGASPEDLRWHIERTTIGAGE